MGRCVAVNLEALYACSDARVELIEDVAPAYWATDTDGCEEFIPERVSTSVIVRLWPNIQLTMDVNLEDSIAWSCDRNGHVYNLLRDYEIPCQAF